MHRHYMAITPLDMHEFFGISKTLKKSNNISKFEIFQKKRYTNYEMGC